MDMGKLRRKVRRGCALLLSLMVLVCAAVTAGAAGAPDLDMTRTGSVSLTLVDGDGSAVSGGAVTLYQVAILYLDDGNMTYAFTDAFSDCQTVLDVEDTGLAAQLTAYAQENSLSGTTKTVGTDGKASFEGLELGLYLIVQTEGSENYETINPFVVTVPIEDDGTWVYDVDASPKVGPVSAVEVTTTVQAETPEPTAPETTTQPATEQETTTQTELVQTGQLNWPLPVLAAAGVVLIAAGLILSCSDKRKNKDAT